VNLYRSAVVVLSVVFIVIGFVLLARTAMEGGGVFGFLLGALFVGLGAGRLTLALRRS
jgi:hypothetical protein